jgi:hypothetical protein
MRILFTCIVYILLSNKICAQSPVTYTYDNNGNRLTRSITLKKSNASSDSISEDESKKEIYKEEIGEVQIRIFPNPTKGILAVEISGVSTEKLIEYSLYNSSGSFLKKQKFSDLQFSIDFTNHPSGIYILRLSIEGEVSEWKIIKE